MPKETLYINITRAERGGMWGGGVPLPTGGGAWGGGYAPSAENLESRAQNALLYCRLAE